MQFPNWLPEDPSKKAAAKQGLMQFGASLLGGRGNFGEILGQGLQAGSQGYQGALAQQQAQALRKLQEQQVSLENQKLQAAVDEPLALARIAQGVGQPGVKTISALPQVGQAQPQAQAQTAPAAQGPATGSYEYYTQLAQAYAASGKNSAAKTAMDLAEKARPKLKEQKTVTRDGKRVLVNVDEFGQSSVVEGFTPDLEKLSFQDAGGAINALDPFTGLPKNTIKKTVTPDTVMRDATDRRGQNMVDARAKATAAAALAAANSSEGMLDDQTVAIMAEQYRAGDTSVMQNLGRGAQGAKNIIRLRQEITRQTVGEGKGGRDLAAQNAEFFGTKAGQRSAGTRIANVEMASYEAESLIPLAQQASAAVARSGFLPFGKGQVMFNEQTNSPEMRQFAAANNALVNVYSRAISPSGVPTVSDKEHAREMISTAMSPDAYNAVLAQMQKEITAARAAPKQVRKAFNEAVTGRDSHSPASVKDLPKKAAVPADVDALLKKYGNK